MTGTLTLPQRIANGYEVIGQFVERFLPVATDEANQLSLIDYAQMMRPSYQASTVHRFLAGKLEAVARGEITRLIISYPPRHGKTELASITFPSWVLGRQPTKSVIATSYTGHLANRNSRRARNMIRDGRYPFPTRLAGDRAAVQQWVTTGGGEYNAAGVGGSITGMGADILIIDDYVKNIAEADSPERREAVWEWYTDTAYPRLQENGAVIVIGTRWNEDDLIGRLLKSERDGTGDVWDKVILKAVAEYDAEYPDPLGRSPGTPLWPERFPLPELMKRKAVMSSRQWRAQYQSSPVADEGGVFKRFWWRFWHPQGMPLPPVRMKMGDGTEHICPTIPSPTTWDDVIQSWDLSFDDKEGNSYVAGLVAAKSSHELYLLDRYHARASFVEASRAIRAMSALWPLSGKKWIENKANGPAVISALTTPQPGIPTVPGIIPVEPHGNKLARAEAVSGFVEAGNVILPHPSIAPWVLGGENGFIDELAAFPASAFADQVDAFSQLLDNVYLGPGQGGVVSSEQYVSWSDTDDFDPWASPGEPGYRPPEQWPRGN